MMVAGENERERERDMCVCVCVCVCARACVCERERENNFWVLNCCCCRTIKASFIISPLSVRARAGNNKTRAHARAHPELTLICSTSNVTSVRAKAERVAAVWGQFNSNLHSHQSVFDIISFSIKCRSDFSLSKVESVQQRRRQSNTRETII